MAELLRALEVFVDIVDMHEHVLVDLIGTGDPKAAPPRAHHDGSFTHGQLRVRDFAVRSRRPQALRETERSAEPLDCRADIFVDEDWDDRCAGADRLLTISAP